MSVVTPRMKTNIRRQDLFAVVTITAPNGRTLTTTARRDIQTGDREIENFKRHLANLPLLRETK